MGLPWRVCHDARTRPARCYAQQRVVATREIEIASHRNFVVLGIYQALEHKVQQDAPKVEFAEAVTASDAEHTITEASKTLGIRPKKFFDWLRANGFIYKQGTQAMQFSINKGLMVTRFHSFTHSDGEKDQKTHAHVTGKGIFYFYRRLLQEGLIARNPNLELTA